MFYLPGLKGIPGAYKPLLMAAADVSPGYDKVPALGTNQCQGSRGYLGGTLSNVFWRVTINSCPSLFADIPVPTGYEYAGNFQTAVCRAVDSELTYGALWPPYFEQSPIYGWGVWSDNPTRSWHLAKSLLGDRDSYDVGRALYANNTPYYPPPNRPQFVLPVDPDPPRVVDERYSLSHYVTLNDSGLPYYIGWPMFTISVRPLSRTNNYEGFDSATVPHEHCQICVGLTWGVRWYGNMLYNWGVLWGDDDDSTVWNDVNIFGGSGVTLPFRVQGAWDGENFTPSFADPDTTDWSGTTLHISREPKPAWNYNEPGWSGRPEQW